MHPEHLLAVQFLGFLIAWSTVVVCLVRPFVVRLDPRVQLMVWTTPESFRVLGVGLLVPALSPGLPQDFAMATAIGDGITAALAITALWLLKLCWKYDRWFVGACHIVGLLDLAIALPHAARVGAAGHLAAQWYVPVLGVPLMLICHVMALATLLSHCRPHDKV